MSPSETSELPDYLEHPVEALHYYKSQGIEQVVCEEKHMGSRAMLVICQDEQVALSRFGIENEGIGICYTRTDRNFFNDTALEQSFLHRVRNTLTKADFWKEFDTDWVCLDAELMPWSAKAQALLKDQYAAVGASASAALSEVVDTLKVAQQRNMDGVDQLYAAYSQKQQMVNDFIAAYQHYCWPVNSVDDLKLAPFHILATEGNVHTDKNHVWHMEMIARICQADPQMMVATSYKLVNLHDEETVKEAVSWWEALTSSGGEGMVVKPLDFISYGKKGLV